MKKERTGFLERLGILRKGNEKDDSMYYRKPNGKNEYARIYTDRGHEDIANRIFREEGYNRVIERIRQEYGKEIDKWRFLIYAGYIQVNEGGIKKIKYREGQKDFKQLIYCSYALNEENLAFVEIKKEKWKDDEDAIIEDMSDPRTPKEYMEKIKDNVDIVKSEIEKMKANNRSAQNELY